MLQAIDTHKPTRRRSGLVRTVRFRVLGVVFLALLVGGVYLTHALFAKKFSDYEEVTLQTSTIGLQLPKRADVKVRGVIVGEVLDYRPVGDGAEVTLGIYPDEVDTIPANVTGSIVPKTLFGEKYVALVVPDQPAAAPIAAGDVITRTAVATEVEAVLNDLYPLLRTVSPADLNRTLNALATALEGRGETLGQTLETADAYLKRLNPQIPALIEDLRLTTTVAGTYSDVLPEVAQILQDTIKTTGTLEEQAGPLTQMLGDVTSAADVGTRFLETNENNLIRLEQLARPMMQTLARYAPEFPCLTGGLDELGIREAEAWEGHTLHIVLETLPRQPRAYTAADTPVFGEDRGPGCGHLPLPPWTQKNPLRSSPDLNDGVDEPTGKGTQRAATGFYRDGMGYAGGPAEKRVLSELLAPGLGVTADRVPDLGQLLVGPMARGATVTMR